MTGFAMALHGGAGARRDRDYAREIAHMRGLVELGRDRLRAGASALDVAVETVVALEDSGLYIAGRGASPNAEGVYELDASVMDGASGDAGAVAALIGFRSPVTAARAVMVRTPHVLLVGEGAATFAREQGLPTVDDPDAFHTRAAADEANHAPGALTHGTVGCVVRDGEGRLASATSTGGVFGKLPGRVGDTPLIGAATWADARVAVSCTGQGEHFVRLAIAVQIAHRMRFAGEDLRTATAGALDDLRGVGGDGGLIAVDAGGDIAAPFASQGMKRATLSTAGQIEAAAL